jgi:hypothetical protein
MTTPVISELHEKIHPLARQCLDAYGWCGVVMCNCGNRWNTAEYHCGTGPIGGLQGFDYGVEYICQKQVIYRRETDLERAQKHRAGLKRPSAIAHWDQVVAEAEDELRSARELLDLLLTLPLRMHIWEQVDKQLAELL